MPTTLLTVRFPDGQSEYTTSEAIPEVGDVLERNGTAWVVVEATEGTDGAVCVTLSVRPSATARAPAYDSIPAS